MRLHHNGSVGNRTEKAEAPSKNLCLVTFTSVLGMTQIEIVKYISTEDLNNWIERYKNSYCPTATHMISHIVNAKLSDNIQIA